MELINNLPLIDDQLGINILKESTIFLGDILNEVKKVEKEILAEFINAYGSKGQQWLNEVNPLYENFSIFFEGKLENSYEKWSKANSNFYEDKWNPEERGDPYIDSFMEREKIFITGQIENFGLNPLSNSFFRKKKITKKINKTE